MSAGALLSITNLRQLFTFGQPGDRVGPMPDDIRQIHTVARQLFHGLLGQRFIDPATLEKLVWSLERQIEAGQDLQSHLSDCQTSEEAQAELADLIAYFEAVHHTIAGRLDARRSVVRPPQH